MLIHEKRLPGIIKIYGCLDFFLSFKMFKSASSAVISEQKLYEGELSVPHTVTVDWTTDDWRTDRRTDGLTDRRKYEGTNRRLSGFLKSGYHRSKEKKPSFLRYTNCLSIEQQSPFHAQVCTYTEQRLLHSVGDTFKHSSLNRVSRKGSTEVNL